MIRKCKSIVLLCLLSAYVFAMLGITVIHAGSEEEIGRSNLGEWKGGQFYEYMTKEFLHEDNQNDTITYRIRYRLKHWGAWYTFQVTPINLFINDQYITTFSSAINVRVVNEDRVNGVYDVTMKKGINNKMELRDTGVSITIINVAGNVFAPLPSYKVTFVDGFGHTLKEENVIKYKAATPPDTPTKDGYTFLGWSDSYQNITSDKVIKATWEQRSYQLKISPNGGEWKGSREDVVYQQHAGVKREIPNPIREGYMFHGWSLEGLGLLDGYINQLKDASTFDVKYTISARDGGWQKKTMNADNSSIQTMEAIRMELGNSLDSFFSIEYRAYCQDIGWQDWKRDGDMAGTYQSNKAMEAIQIQLQGRLCAYYDIEYRAYVENVGWMPWVRNAQIAGTIGESKALQCLQIRLVRVKESTPENTTYYGLSGNATLRAVWLPLPYIDAAYDRWFLVQEDIRQEDLLQVIKAYDEYHNDIRNTLVLDNFASIVPHTVGDYNVQVHAVSAMGNTCHATITVHVVDVLTKENIRSIDTPYMNTLDEKSKWQKNVTILKHKISDGDMEKTIVLQQKRED